MSKLMKWMTGVTSVLGAVMFGLVLQARADWVTLPSFTQIEASSTPYASGIFTSFLGLILFVLGIIVGVLVLKLVISSVGRGAKAILKGGRRRR